MRGVEWDGKDEFEALRFCTTRENTAPATVANAPWTRLLGKLADCELFFNLLFNIPFVMRSFPAR